MDKTENDLRNYEAIKESLSQLIGPYLYVDGLDMVSCWTESGDWQIEDFITFMQLIGVKSLLSYTCHTNLFDCYDNFDRHMQLSLHSGTQNRYPEIWIKEDVDNQKQQIIYKYRSNTNSKEKPTVPKVVLFQRNIEICNGNKLVINFSENCYKADLTMPDRCYGLHKLSIEINDSIFKTLYISNKNNTPRDYFQDYLRVEHYLLSLTPKHFVLDNVYERVMGLFGFIDESTCKKALFFYLNEQGEQLSTVHKKDGKMQEYAVFEDKEIYHVWKNGDRKYHSDIITFSYSSKEDYYDFHVKGENLQTVLSASPAISWEYIQNRFDKLIKFAFY